MGLYWWKIILYLLSFELENDKKQSGIAGRINVRAVDQRTH